MKIVRQLFSFNENQIKESFEAARFSSSLSGFKLLIAPPIAEHGKLLVIAGRRYGKAHERNKIRRQIKSIFYEERLFERAATWILVVYPQAKELSFSQIKEFLVLSMQAKS